jgi:hypothetical protein
MPDGIDIHWTLERLRQTIADHFGITLGINTIWVWLGKEHRRFKAPRPRHAKGDEEAQTALKKSLTWWAVTPTPRFSFLTRCGQLVFALGEH